jgi:hypothetical protein
MVVVVGWWCLVVAAVVVGFVVAMSGVSDNGGSSAVSCALGFAALHGLMYWLYTNVIFFLFPRQKAGVEMSTRGIRQCKNNDFSIVSSRSFH